MIFLEMSINAFSLKKLNVYSHEHKLFSQMILISTFIWSQYKMKEENIFLFVLILLLSNEKYIKSSCA